MSLSEKEIFDADIIKNHFSGTYLEGEDPPDIYLTLNSCPIAIELTELNVNIQDNRTSIDLAYLGLISNLEIPDYKLYKVVIYHANINLNKKRRKAINDFLRHAKENESKCLNGIFVQLTIDEQEKKDGQVFPFCLPLDKCNRDISIVSKNLSYFNIDDTFKVILDKAIETKKVKCKDIEIEVWLALHDNYNSYFNKCDADSFDFYTKAMEGIDFGLFNKILIIYGDKKLIEFNP